MITIGGRKVRRSMRRSKKMQKMKRKIVMSPSLPIPEMAKVKGTKRRRDDLIRVTSNAIIVINFPIFLMNVGQIRESRMKEPM